jgi:hypothetical protein
MRSPRSLSLVLLASLAACVAAANSGCSTTEPGGSSGEDIRAGERSIIGDAVPYAADLTLRAREDELRKSMKKRREVAWKAFARVLKQVEIRDPAASAVDGGTDASGDGGAAIKAKLPLFRTWYGRDDFQRIFATLWDGLTPNQRQARSPFSQTKIGEAIKLNYGSRGSWTDADYLDRIRQLTDEESLQGLAGNGRVSYSPGYVKHFFENYSQVYRCLDLLPSLPLTEPPPSSTNFAQCYKSEFEPDAAVIKASYYRANLGGGLPVRDTSAAAMTKRRNGSIDQGGWGKGGAEVVPEPGSIYTVKMSDGNSFYLPGIHLITKELRDWLWVTFWWSPNPNEDFGADRPQEIVDLGGPWKNYKMAVSVGYAEEDTDPRGGYQGSLGDALQATYEGVGGPTWASNPYIEKGDHNAQTNCIGCHQHSGDPNIELASLLSAEDKFPKAARTKLRASFATDYTWSFSMAPEAFSEIIRKQIESR